MLQDSKQIEDNLNFAYDSTGNIGFKDISDIYSIYDIWSWLRLGFVPTLLNDKYIYSEDNFPLPNLGSIAGDPPDLVDLAGYPRQVPHVKDFIFYNLIVSDLRLQQGTKQQKDCDRVPDNMKAGLGTLERGAKYYIIFHHL